MGKNINVHVLHTARVQNCAVATIPQPPPTYRLETAVRIGSRGPEYTVVACENGSDAAIYPAFSPRSRKMRLCPRRDAILSAVARQAAAYGESLKGWKGT